MPNTDPNSIPACTHTKTNGTRCGSPAVKGTALCFHHSAVKTALGKVARPTEYQEYPPIQFLYPEDRASIQINYFLLMQAISEDRIDPRKARVLFQLLRATAINLGNMSLDETGVGGEAGARVSKPAAEAVTSAAEAPKPEARQEKPFVSANAAKAMATPHPAGGVAKQSFNPAINVAAVALNNPPKTGSFSVDEVADAISKMSKPEYFPSSTSLL